MKLEILAINLYRSTDRWETMSQTAAALRLVRTRVSAVNGKLTPEAARELVNDAAFQLDTGRLMLANACGCYNSHLKALNAFLTTTNDIALIIEDDVELCDRAQAAFEADPSADVIKFPFTVSSAFQRPRHRAGGMTSAALFTARSVNPPVMPYLGGGQRS